MPREARQGQGWGEGMGRRDTALSASSCAWLSGLHCALTRPRQHVTMSPHRSLYICMHKGQLSMCLQIPRTRLRGRAHSIQ